MPTPVKAEAVHRSTNMFGRVRNFMDYLPETPARGASARRRSASSN
jgi:hypothetical protein